MVKLSREVVVAIVTEFGIDEMLQRLSDPFWFQALGCVLGWDWHSSGTTTVVCGALKEGLKEVGRELGLYVAGGKGGTSRKTPDEVMKVGDDTGLDAEPLVYASKMSAKVDSTALQDGYQIYHHAFFFTVKGDWAVVQQGMNNVNGYARRYHWLGQNVQDFVCEPHTAICAQSRAYTLNMVASESEQARDVVAQLAADKTPETILSEIKHLQSCDLPARHQILVQDIHPDRLYRTFVSTFERKAPDFESLLAIPGVGAKSIRSLALLSELLYGAKPSTSDPARFSFAHGGKDGIPYPVDRPTYDKTIDVLKSAVRKAKLGIREEMEALRRLHKLFD
ncbi:DUF763 domain-containing protein [Chloroflexota bacterium]